MQDRAEFTEHFPDRHDKVNSVLSYTLPIAFRCKKFQFCHSAHRWSTENDVGASQSEALPLSMSDVEAAMKRIRDHIHYTPVMTCSYLNSISGLQLYFKCENFQKTGAFKVARTSSCTSSSGSYSGTPL